MLFDLIKDGKKVGVINTNSTKYINQKYVLIQSGVKESTPKQSTINMVSKQIQALSDRSDFLEDCIAEMATLVYNTEETT